MNLAQLWRAARRRLPLLVVGLLASVLAAGVVATVEPSFYQSRIGLVLLTPQRAEPGEAALPTNPLLGTGSKSAQVTATGVVEAAQGQQFAQDLVRRGVTSEVSVAGVASGSVMLEVTATSSDRDRSAQDLQTVVGALDNLTRQQQVINGAPVSELYQTFRFAEAEPPRQLPDDRVKATATTFVLGVLLTVLVLAHLERRRAPAASAGAPGPTNSERVEPGVR